MNKIVAVFCFFILSIVDANAQISPDSIAIKFNLKWNNNPLETNKKYYSKNDSLQISTLKFYVSNLIIKHDDHSIFQEKNSYHLIDIANSKSLNFNICKKSEKSISAIEFNVGIDSLKSVSGALSGDLDATKGMYWAWQSGFINMKIEGTSNSCDTRKNQFNFHIGGYKKPNFAMRKIKCIANQNTKNEISVAVDLAKLFNAIDLKQNNSIMIPCEKSMKMADLSTRMFTLE